MCNKAVATISNWNNYTYLCINNEKLYLLRAMLTATQSQVWHSISIPSSGVRPHQTEVHSLVRALDVWQRGRPWNREAMSHLNHWAWNQNFLDFWYELHDRGALLKSVTWKDSQLRPKIQKIVFSFSAVHLWSGVNIWIKASNTETMLVKVWHGCDAFDTINILKKNFSLIHGNENKEMRHIFIIVIFQKSLFNNFRSS